jgi:hypothetical protein
MEMERDTCHGGTAPRIGADKGLGQIAPFQHGHGGSGPFWRRRHGLGHGFRRRRSQSVAGVDRARGGEQFPGIGMDRLGEDAIGRAFFHDAPLLHHGDPVGQPGHHGQIMADDQHGPVWPAQGFKQTHDLRLHGGIQRGRRLVGDQQIRIGGNG